MTRPTPERLVEIRRVYGFGFGDMPQELIAEIDALTAERDSAICAENVERDARITTQRKLLRLLDRARTGTRPDGSGCWCDPDEWSNEAPRGATSATLMGFHTSLCREVAAAMQ